MTFRRRPARAGCLPKARSGRHAGEEAVVVLSCVRVEGREDLCCDEPAPTGVGHEVGAVPRKPSNAFAS